MIIALIYYIFFLQKPPFYIHNGGFYYISLARFISSLMMHINIEPDIRQGLTLAKYCVNHPFRFKDSRYIDELGIERIRISKILPPFFIAISQILTSLVIEFISLLYLNSLDSLMSTVTQFIIFLGITKFDNMYADNLI